MKEYAIVTEKTLEQYRLSGFEAGNIFRIQSRAKRNGKDWFNIITPSGLVAGYQEEYFEIKTVTDEDERSERLAGALKDLTACMFEHNARIKETLEVLAENNVNPAIIADEFQAHLVSFIKHDSHKELESVLEWIKPTEVEEGE